MEHFAFSRRTEHNALSRTRTRTELHEGKNPCHTERKNGIMRRSLLTFIYMLPQNVQIGRKLVTVYFTAKKLLLSPKSSKIPNFKCLISIFHRQYRCRQVQRPFWLNPPSITTIRTTSTSTCFQNVQFNR